MKFPVFDLHCDTATEATRYGHGPFRRLKTNDGHVDLKRGGKLPGYAQCFAFFTTPLQNAFCKWTPQELFQRSLSNFQKELEENSGVIAQAFNPGQARELVNAGKIAAVFTLEGPAAIDFDPGRLEELHRLGFQMTTLTWNEENPLAGSHRTGGGLTDKGRVFVKKAQSLGMAIDVSHLSERAFWDIMNVTEGPVSASHSNSRAVCGVSRNLTDEQFKAICQTGGVAGLNLYTDFLGTGEVNADTVCDHVLHWFSLGGEKHVALGGDLDGCEALPRAFTGVDSWELLADALLRRGLTEAQVEDIFWNNAMRMWSQCCM